MILEAILNSVKIIFIDIIFGVFDLLPGLPADITDSIDSFFELIFSNCSLLSFFIPIGYVATCLGVSLAISQMDKLYRLIMWILRKIPVLGIE